MDDEKKENAEEDFIPEQLDDEDFENEKAEAKRLKAEKKAKKKQEKKNHKEAMKSAISDDESGIEDEENKKPKSNTLKIALILVIIAVVITAIFVYINGGIEVSKGDDPKAVVSDFCAYFNSGNWEKVASFVDFKGYYVLGYSLDEADYTKFYSTYNDFDEEDETYVSSMEYIESCQELDSELYDAIAEVISISLVSSDEPVLIQGTEGLYKIRIILDTAYNGEKSTETQDVYVAKINGEYKIVYGYLPDLLLSMYQTAYYYGSYYGY
jgi:hypothetical protein